MHKCCKTVCLWVCFLSAAAPAGLLAQAPAGAPVVAPARRHETQAARSEPHETNEQEAPNEAEREAARPPSRAELAAREGRAFIAHVPRGSAPLDAIQLVMDVRGADLAGEIRVYYRPLERADTPPRYVVVRREASGYAAHIPPEQVQAPGVAYWIVEHMPDGSDRAVFASPADPAPLYVMLSQVETRERRLLADNGGRRSQATLRGEWVDLGGFEVRSGTPGGKERDHYYHLEAQYAYSFYRTIDEIEFALGHLRGDVLDQSQLTTQSKVGLDYGRSALTFAFGSWFRIRTGVLLGVSTEGFEGGFELGLIVGDRRGTQLSLDGGYVTRLGGRVGTRLGWATIPRLPMGARVEITNFPTDDYLGVRLLFDLGFELTPAASIRLEAGYRGRTSLAGGPSLGLVLRYGF
jgi:hypothetical protein